MKPKNFPGRRVQRQIEAATRKKGDRPNHTYWTDEEMMQYAQAYDVRTKKDRSGKKL